MKAFALSATFVLFAASVAHAETFCLKGAASSCGYGYLWCVESRIDIDGSSSCEATYPPQYCTLVGGEEELVLSGSPEFPWVAEGSKEDGLFLWLLEGAWDTYGAIYGFSYAELHLSGESEAIGYVPATGFGELTAWGSGQRLELWLDCFRPGEAFLLGQLIFAETDTTSARSWQGVNSLYR